MKWSNRGHELDGKAQKIVSSFQENGERFYIFGAGLIGRYAKSILTRYQWFGGFIDNNAKKIEEGYDGACVCSFDQFVKEKKGLIVIAASRSNTPVIAKQIESAGFVEGKDFFTCADFEQSVLSILSLYLRKEVFVSSCQICVTERCSLKCKKCAHACYAVGNDAVDLLLEDVCCSADKFFAKVDLAGQFVLIGGEPLLYRDLAEAVEYIGSRYRGQIVNFCITTNGTILPTAELLEACAKYDVKFQISNYAHSIPRLHEQHRKLKAVLEAHSISYLLEKEEQYWMDYGFEYVRRPADENELVRVFDECATVCKEIRRNRLYYCVSARSVADNLHFPNVGEDDYLDMDALEGDEGKRILTEFSLGYSEKGYLDMCRHCNGADSKNFLIPAAEQVSR